MDHQRTEFWSRRNFLGGLTLAGTVSLLDLHVGPVAAEPPPETTTIKLVQFPGICTAPLYVAEDLLPGEGFSDVQYVWVGGGLFTRALASGEVDITLNFVGPLLIRVDAGDPIVILAGGHVGCFELIATVRFYVLRLHEARMIKSSPQKLIAQGTDWRFLSEIKKELKGKEGDDGMTRVTWV